MQALTLDGSTFGKRTIRVTTCGKRTKRTAMTPEEKREQEVAFRAEKHMVCTSPDCINAAASIHKPIFTVVLCCAFSNQGAISGAAKRIRAKAAKNPNPGKKGGKAGKRSKPGKPGKPGKAGKPKGKGKPKAQK